MTGAVHQWQPVRSRVLPVACSDGGLQEATDAFLADKLGLTEYDRLYMPGGGGALAASGRDFIRAQQLRRECLRRDAMELVGRCDEWAGSAAVSAHWCEVDAGFRITFREMDRGQGDA